MCIRDSLEGELEKLKDGIQKFEKVSGITITKFWKKLQDDEDLKKKAKIIKYVIDGGLTSPIPDRQISNIIGSLERAIVNVKEVQTVHKEIKALEAEEFSKATKQP